MSSAARIAATAASLTTRAAIAIVQNVRARRRRIGLRPARPICCRSAISTSSSRYPPRSGLYAGGTAFAQQPGGILRVHALDYPPSLSMHEEVDAVPARAMMAVFNNLVMFDQHTKQNNMQSIVPDLATDWSWSEDGTQLTFTLRKGA